MGKTGEVLRPILFIVGGAFVLQVPLFIVLLKLAELKGCDNVFSRAGQALFLGSTGSAGSLNTSPLAVAIAPSSSLSSASASSSLSSEVSSAFQPLSFANYPFVLFSIYRHRKNSFYVIGITSVIVRRYENDQPVYRCEWVPGTGNISAGGAQTSSFYEDHTIVTEARMLYVSFDENGMAYAPAVVNCTFNQSVGAHGEGGLLRLHLSKGPSFWDPHYVVEDVFREKPAVEMEKTPPRRGLEAEDEDEENAEELRHKYAFCGPPMYGTEQNRDWIQKWLAYHHYLWGGKAHFYFYVAEGLDTAAREMLEPWIKAGLLTLIEAGGGEAYPSWYRNQLLFINDCIYRTRFTARWTFFHDLDELLYVPAPNTLDGLLEENRDKPWMTFGNLPFSTDHCTRIIMQSSSGEDWQLERFLWRKTQPECMHDWEDPWNCLAAPGRRKYVVNPRKVFLSGVHRVALPEEGGVNFNASVAKVHHFHGILNPRMNVCNHLVNISGDSDEQQPDSLEYVLDGAVASLMPKVRSFAGSLLPPSSKFLTDAH